ncbi:MAG: PAS domain-containing protein, partial [Acidobacteriales bacterium]|nr:PAS domain-containing protein [Terriglobales bacterium]
DRLRDSEERLSLILKAADLGFWDWNLKTDDLLWSDRCLALFGIPPGTKMSFARFLEAVHPDDRERVDRYSHAVIEHHLEFATEMRAVWPDGSIHWMVSRGRPFYDESGAPVRMSGAVLEITERKRNEEALQQSQRELTAFADTIPTLAFIANADGYITWYNDRWYEYTGTTPQQMEGWGWQSVHDPEILPTVLKRWSASISTGEPFEMIFPIRGADGIFRQFLTRIVPVKDDSGKVSRWFGTNTEIDELERARLKLQQQQAELRETNQLIELAQVATQVGFWHYQPATGIAYLSPGVQRLLGLDFADRVHVDRVIQSIHPEDQARVRRELERGLATGEYRSDFRVPQPDGSTRWLSGHGRVITSNTHSYMVGINADITLLKQTEEALRESEKLAIVGRMAASISHEINNPLEAVTNLLYLIRTSEASPDITELARTAEDELARVTHIVTHTLRFNRQTTRAAHERLSSLLDSAIAIFGSRIRHAGIDLRTEYQDTRTVFCFPAEIRQVFSNLIGNAYDASHPRSTIIIRTSDARHPRTGQPGVRVSVADTGNGMGPSTLNRLFQPFFSTKGNNGTGLGLWISKSILEKHAASLQVKSRPGYGTVFSIFFPLDGVPEETATRVATTV